MATGRIFLASLAMCLVTVLPEADAAQKPEPPGDLKDIDVRHHGIEPVEPKKDSKTGFIVGGTNSTKSLKTLTALAGRAIADLERDMRPGAKVESGSDAGFLGKDERLLDVLAADNAYIVDKQGLTHQQLARHLHALGVVAAEYPKQQVTYHGRRYKTELFLTRGYQLSPFNDGTKTNAEVTVENLDTGKAIKYSLLVPLMIERYGFYEGHGTPYRVEPAKVLEVFDFLASQPTKASLVEGRKIWDAAPHNAFTDLIRFQDRWYCAFREGAGHVSPDGAIQVLTSSDGEKWESAARLTSSTSDLRDPKITTTPDGRLMLSGAEAIDGGKVHQSLVWFSDNGRDWSERTEIGRRDDWLWRVVWHDDAAYSLGYGCRPDDQVVRLYKSNDGKKFETLVDPLHVEGYPNESALVFTGDETCYCLLRRDGTPNTGLLGTSKPPYTAWQWRDLGVRIGGPQMIRLPNGRFIATVRLYDGAVRTSICAVDVTAGSITELLKLPSGGDTSYAGLVWHDNLLWVSYYSSHEGKTSIYLAKVQID